MTWRSPAGRPVTAASTWDSSPHVAAQRANGCADILGSVNEYEYIERGPGRHGGVETRSTCTCATPTGTAWSVHLRYSAPATRAPVLRWSVLDQRRRDFLGPRGSRPSWYSEARRCCDLDGKVVPVAEIEVYTSMRCRRVAQVHVETRSNDTPCRPGPRSMYSYSLTEPRMSHIRSTLCGSWAKNPR